MTVYRNDNQHPCPNARGQLPVACDGVLLLKEFEREIYVYVYFFFQLLSLELVPLHAQLQARFAHSG